MDTLQAELPEESQATAEIEWAALTAHDRCEGRTATGRGGKATTCNAQAFVRYAKDEADLLFCGHCHGIHQMTLEFQGFKVVQNDLHKINVKPSESST